MNKSLSLLLAAFCAGSACAEPVYRNGPGQGRASSLVLFGPSEYGDEVTLAGTARNITEMSVYFIADVVAPQADERFRIRFYALDGTPVNGKPSPSTLLWDSGLLSYKYYWRAQRILVPSVTVPNTFVWTFQSSGTNQISEDQIGPDQFGPPELGSSTAHYWSRNGGPWTWTAPANQWEGSLGANFWAGGSPNTPYNNIGTFLNATSFLNQEYGDDVCFEGTTRTITSMQLRVNAEFNTPQGDETLVVRLYSHVGTDPFGSPNATPLWTSSNIAVPNGMNTITVPVPGITLPDNIVYTVRFQGMGMTAGDRAGLMHYSPPLVGASHILYWVRDGFTPPNGFYSDWFGDPTPVSTFPIANFGARFNASAAPVSFDPTNGTTGPGTTIAGSWTDMLASDDIRWQIRPGAILVATADPAVAVISGTALGNSPNSLTVTIESSASVGGIRQILEARKYSDSTWTTLETFTPLPFGASPDRVTTVTIPSPSLHIGPANAVQLRVKFKNTTAVLVYPWRARIDRVYWTYTP